MLYTPRLDLFSWQARHAYRYAVLNDKYKYNKSQNKVMLEDITLSPTAIVASTIAATTIAVPVSLSLLTDWCQKDSAPVIDEADAHSHFQKVLSHYHQNPATLELRCSYKGGTYVTRVGDKYVVFLDMNTRPRKASIQHEVLHVVSGDTKYDPANGNLLEQTKNWARYFCYIEPRVLLRTKKELLG